MVVSVTGSAVTARSESDGQPGGRPGRTQAATSSLSPVRGNVAGPCPAAAALGHRDDRAQAPSQSPSHSQALSDDDGADSCGASALPQFSPVILRNIDEYWRF